MNVVGVSLTRTCIIVKKSQSALQCQLVIALGGSFLGKYTTAFGSTAVTLTLTLALFDSYEERFWEVSAKQDRQDQGSCSRLKTPATGMSWTG